MGFDLNILQSGAPSRNLPLSKGLVLLTEKPQHLGVYAGVFIGISIEQIEVYGRLTAALRQSKCDN
jgi:hypothetical protein